LAWRRRRRNEGVRRRTGRGKKRNSCGGKKGVEIE
jgi:hypothetical protein